MTIIKRSSSVNKYQYTPFLWPHLTGVCPLVLEQVCDHGGVQGTRGVVEHHGLGLLHRQHAEHGVPAEGRVKLGVTGVNIGSSPGRLAPAVVAPGGEGLQGEDAGDVDKHHP